MPVYEYNASSDKLNLVAGGTLYADLPIGSWVKNDSNETPSGFLKAGDAIDPTLYPELYAMYGSTVPYKADTSELGDYENITFPTSLQVTAQYDGVIITTAYDGGYLTFNINDHKAYIRTQSSGINAGATTVPFRKGDVIRVEGADGNYTINVRYYNKSLIVKAKQVSVPFDVAEYIRKWNSPDWDNAIDVITYVQDEAGPKTYTAIDDGFIAGTISARYTSSTKVFVNDIAIGGVIGINNAIEGNGGVFAKVNKDDVIKITVGNAGSMGIAIKFVPHK